MKHYAGIDVSLNSSSVCVVDESGKIVREVKLASEPVALIHCIKSFGVRVEQAPTLCSARCAKYFCARESLAEKHGARCPELSDQILIMAPHQALIFSSADVGVDCGLRFGALVPPDWIVGYDIVDDSTMVVK